MTKLDELLSTMEYLKTSITYFDENATEANRNMKRLMEARLRGIEEALIALSVLPDPADHILS